MLSRTTTVDLRPDGLGDWKLENFAIVSPNLAAKLRVLIVGINKKLFKMATQNTVLGPSKVISSGSESSSELMSSAVSKQ